MGGAGYWICTDVGERAGCILPHQGFVSLDTARTRAIHLFAQSPIPLLIYAVPDMSTVRERRVIAYDDWVPVDGIDAISATVGTFQQYKTTHLTDLDAPPLIADGPTLPDRIYRLSVTSVPNGILAGAVTGTPYRSVDITVNVLLDTDNNPATANPLDNEPSPVWQFRAIAPTDDESTAAWSEPTAGPYTFTGLMPNCPYRIECVDIDDETFVPWSYAPTAAPRPTLGAVDFKDDTTSTIQWAKPLDAVWSDDGGSLQRIVLSFVGRTASGAIGSGYSTGTLAPHTNGGTTNVPAYTNEDPVTGEPMLTYCAVVNAEYGGSWGSGFFDGPVPDNQSLFELPEPAPFPPSLPEGFPASIRNNEFTNPSLVSHLAERCGLVPGKTVQTGGQGAKWKPRTLMTNPCGDSTQAGVTFPLDVQSGTLVDARVAINPRNTLIVQATVSKTGFDLTAGIEVDDKGTGLGNFLTKATGTPCVQLGFDASAGVRYGKGKGLGRPKIRKDFNFGGQLTLGSGGKQPITIPIKV